MTFKRYQLIVLMWAGGSWCEYLRRGDLASREQANMLGREEVARVIWRTNYRRVSFVVREQPEFPRESAVTKMIQ
jgi:hypothetical protein